MLLQLKNIKKKYLANGKSVEAIRDVSLDIDAGEVCAIRGKSGCGKSTLLLAAGGLLRPDQGQVVLDGEDLYRISAKHRARLRATRCGFVFQQFHLIPYIDVVGNIMTASMAAGAKAAGAKSVRQRTGALLDRFDLTDRQHHRPGQLSTGERQRVAMIRALLNGPKVLLADEPTGNLDDENSEIVLQHMRDFADDGGAVLLVTHDDRAAKFATRQLQMHEGQLRD